ncbi:MAG: helix-turn-helix domain-containing protein [Patescibacteria group bacterium]
MKYWNKARIAREREREARAKEKMLLRPRESKRLRTTYTAGNSRKNTALMLDALGSEVNRRMLARLRERGAMSVSKLAEPFRITLPAAVNRVNTLERVGLIKTHKQGRIRFCIYNPSRVKELSVHLASADPFAATDSK